MYQDSACLCRRIQSQTRVDKYELSILITDACGQVRVVYLDRRFREGLGMSFKFHSKRESRYTSRAWPQAPVDLMPEAKPVFFSRITINFQGSTTVLKMFSPHLYRVKDLKQLDVCIIFIVA